MVTEVDKNLPKKLYQVGVWLKQKFDSDNSDDGPKKLFAKSGKCFQLSADLRNSDQPEAVRNENLALGLQGQANKKMTEYLRPMLEGLGIDMKYFKF